MYEHRNREAYELIATNDIYDFYVSKKKLGYCYYTEAWLKGTNISTCMGGFNTKKAAKHCAEVWAGWMGLH